MTIKTAMQQWVKLADYDWKSARAMFNAKLYLYVGFLCHQTLEKLYKALYTKSHAKIPPYTHDLIKLASLTMTPPTEKARQHLNMMNPLYIKCRYPAYKAELSRVLTRKSALGIMRETEELRRWLKFLLK